MARLELEHTLNERNSHRGSGNIPIEDGIAITKYQNREGWAAIPFIIGSMVGLTLSISSWASNLIVFLKKEFNVKSIDATQINNVVLGFNTLLPVAGAIVADVFSCYFVISFFAFLSLLGMILFNLITTIHCLRPSPCELMGSISSCPSPSRLQLAILYITLGLASLGVGGTRFTIATMGAAQFDKPKNQRAFLSLYYLFFYVANGTSLTAMIYIEDNVGWNLAFRICLVSNVIALVLFLSGKRFYRRKPKVERNPFLSIVHVVLAAVKKRNMSGTFGNRDYYYGSVETTNILGDGPSKSLRWLNRAALKVDGDHEQQSSRSNARSWKLCTVEEVEDLKTLLKIIPFWSSTILVSVTISMFNNLVILQALTMDRHIGSHFQVSAGSLVVFNLISVAFSVLIFDFFIIPIWKKLYPHRALTLIPRIGIGHVINILGLVAAALIERRRLHVVRTHQLSSISIVPMSALWLLVPLGVLGIGEALHLIGNIMLFYQEFPKSIKNSSGAMAALILGIGYYLTIAITDLVHKTTRWLPDNINDGRLDNVYWMLAVIGAVNFGYYLICAYKYRYVEKSNDNPNDI